MVIWLLGISGAGKSTLGNLLYRKFQEENKLVYLIDGDEIRSFFENDLGYSREDRIANIKRIIYASYVLSKNNMNVIVCNISPFENLRAFCRKKIPNYIQIYLKRSLETSIKNDVKSVYQQHLGKSDIVGYDIIFEPPLNSDLEIDIEHHSINDSIEIILKKISTISGE